LFFNRIDAERKIILTDLTEEKCVPCESDIPALTRDQINAYKKDVPEWHVIDVDGIPQLKRKFEFKNFIKALEFTNTVGELAEEEGHHPVIELTWGEVTVRWWTHNIKGLHKNDFIMAAKTSESY
jgi:4a-hydroxytetrahydrobiopterin dehydratase